MRSSPLLPCLALLALPSCAEPLGARRTPELPSDQQAHARVRANPLEPLIVEWPASERVELEAQLRAGGVVAVRYDGRTMDVLAQCRAPGAYVFRGTNTHRDSLTIEDQDSLAANLPLGAASLSASLRQAGKLQLQLTLVGTYGASLTTVDRKDLAGDCAGATHVVASVSVGAFELRSAGSTEVGGGARVGGLGGGAEHASRRDVLSRAGDEKACDRASPDASSPPDGCGALVRLALRSVRATVGLPPPAASTTPIASATPPPPRVAPDDPSESPPPDARRTPETNSYSEPSTPPADRTPASSNTWVYVAGAGIIAVLVALGVAAAVAKKDDPKREPPPTGGLGNVTLPTMVRW